MITDWDDAYQIGTYIPGAEDFPPMWEARAAAFRAAHPPEVVAYGKGARQALDLFLPDTAPKGLTMFVHGGYWKAFDRSTWSHLAAGALARDQAVAVPSYTLAPDARISQITAEIAAAISQLADRFPDLPITLTGHSAGGHLVSRMACDGVLRGDIAARLRHVLSISGLHDLRPLLHSGMNEILRLDLAEAIAESPALLFPVQGARLTAAVATDERPELLRQTDLLANIWVGLGAETACHRFPGDNHFTVIGGLEYPDSALTRMLLEH